MLCFRVSVACWFVVGVGCMLLLVVPCVLCVVHCVLSIGGYLLCDACGWLFLFVVYLSLFGVRCLLCVVCRGVFRCVVLCCVVFVVGC